MRNKYSYSHILVQYKYCNLKYHMLRKDGIIYNYELWKPRPELYGK